MIEKNKILKKNFDELEKKFILKKDKIEKMKEQIEILINKINELNQTKNKKSSEISELLFKNSHLKNEVKIKKKII